MARPKLVDRPVSKHISVPTSIAAQVDLLLFSELEMKVPFGAWQSYLIELIRADLAKRAQVDTTVVK